MRVECRQSVRIRIVGVLLYDSSDRLLVVPGQVVPWGASIIIHNRSFLMIHALFCLSYPDLDQIFVTFVTIFVDLVRYVGSHLRRLVGVCSGPFGTCLPQVRMS